MRYKLINLLLICVAFNAIGQGEDSLASRIFDYNISQGLEPDSMIVEVKGFLDQAFVEENIEAQQEAYLKIAAIFKLKEESDSSLFYLSKCYSLAEKQKDTTNMARALNATGVVYKNRGEYNSALEFYERALAFAKAMDDDEVISSTLMHLGVASVRMGQLETAREYYDLSDYYWPDDMEEGKMTLNINMGNLYSRLGEKTKSRNAYNKALDIAIELDDHWRQSLCYNNIAEIDYQEGKNDEAIKKFRKAQTVLGSIESTQVMFYSNLGISLCFHEMGQLDSALFYTRRAVATEMPDRAFTLKRDGAIFLAWIFAERKEYDSAYNYQVEVGHWRDSIDSQNVESKLLEIQVNSRLEQTNRELELSREVEQHHMEELALKNRLLTFGVIFIVLIVGIGLYLGYLVRRLRIASAQLKEQQAELAIKNAELEELNTTKDKLFSILAHDLRSPLNALESLFSIWLVEQESEQSDLFKNLRSSLGTMRQTLDNILHWSKDQIAGSPKVGQEPVDIYPLLERMKEFYTPVASAKDVQILLDQKELEPVQVDPNHLGLILRNLLSNAIKYSPSGGQIALSTTLHNEKLTVCIKDQGCGMPESVLNALLNREPIESSSGTSNEKGTGLGLMLVMEYAELNGIDVRFEILDEGGTKACIDIPIKND